MNVVDSSGWLEYFADGPNAGFFSKAIEATADLIVPTISLYENLPDDASLEDIQYHVYESQKVRKGLEAAREGRTLTHAEVVRRMTTLLRSCER